MKVRASIFSGNGGGLGGTLGGIFGGLATAATGIPQNISIIAQYGVAQRYPHLPPEVLAAAQGIANAAAIGLGLTVLLAGQVFFAWLFSFIGDLHARNGNPAVRPPGGAHANQATSTAPPSAPPPETREA